jgi:chemotaxis signal transduction protein
VNDAQAEPIGSLFLICRISGESFALVASDVERVVRMPALTPLPGARDPVVGAVDLQGTSLLVVDPRIPLKLSAAVVHPNQHLIIVATPERFALWVDRVAQAEFVASDDLEPVPQHGSPLVPFIVCLGQDHVPVLQTSALAPSASTDESHALE